MADEAEPQEAAAKPKPPTVTRKELALRVQKATGAKLRDVQMIVGATLEAMSAALKAGEVLRLPPLGAAKVMRQADPATGTAMRVALRQVKEKDRAPKAERQPRAKSAAKAAKDAKAAKAAGAKAAGAKAAGAKGGKGRGGAKQALATRDEAE